jgi:presenilin-like A22 family membrane protease
MDKRWRALAGCGLVGLIFLFVQLGALALVGPFDTAGYQAVEDPSNPTNSLVYIGAILVATGGMLLAFRYDADALIRGLIVFSGAWLSLYVFRVLVPPVLTLGGVNAIAVGVAVALGIALLVHPEWYVIDTAGAIMGAAAAGLFGISFGVFPAIVLLSVLAVYDAISVYGTEHMLTLASGVMDLKVPVVLVIPLSLSYSFIDMTAPDPESDGEQSDEEHEGEDEPIDTGPLDRDALFIGLGDAVIPTVLVASAAFFAPIGTPIVFGIAVPAFAAMVGTFVGLAVLLWMVLKGKAHAGLPLLNGGTIAGYLIGSILTGVGLVDAIGLAPYI